MVSKGHGWLLGAYRWHYNDGGNYGGVDVTGDCLTVLLDQSEPSYDVHVDRQLTRVVPDSARGGYLLDTNYGTFESGWREIEMKARQLAGQS